MRLKQAIDNIQFLKRVDMCTSNVWFLTREGDRLNLKSTLSKYLFASVSGRKEVFKSGQIECEYEEDYRVLKEFLE